MELATVKDAFEKVVKKQKLSSTKICEVIDQMVEDFEDAVNKLQFVSDGGDPSCSFPRTVLTDLRSKLGEFSRGCQLETSQKDLAVVLTKFTKVLEKHFMLDMSKAHRNVDWDIGTVNRIIAHHLYRQGMFDLCDCFVKESCATTDQLRSLFLELHEILAAMRSRDIGPALGWAGRRCEHLLQVGSDLELRLHKAEFVEILLTGQRDDALAYAKAYLAPFAATHRAEVQKLMASLLWAGRLDTSPYASLAAEDRWDELTKEMIQQFCRDLGLPCTDPLGMVVLAGAQALPVMLKMAAVMAATNQDWQGMKQLLMPVDLSSEFQFHSIFVCPVLWEQATEENPATMLPCGHVLCQQAILKLSKNNSVRAFKCPYCPSDATFSQCRQLYL